MFHRHQHAPVPPAGQECRPTCAARRNENAECVCDIIAAVPALRAKYMPATTWSKPRDVRRPSILEFA